MKDIAERANVSVGTVDRVLHNRPNVSDYARERVSKVLDEIDYKPNTFASALAYNKRSFTFVVLMPAHESEAYWEEVEGGVSKAVDTKPEFNINVKTLYYERFDNASFARACDQCLTYSPNGVVIVPELLEETRRFTDKLHDCRIPFVLLDSYMPDLNPLSFCGQDSIRSGMFAAKIMMLLASGEKQIMLLKQMKEGRVTTRQQQNREGGFRHYMSERYPDVDIIELSIPYNATEAVSDSIFARFFDEHPDVHHCITFNSKAYILGEYLLRNNIRGVQVMGYDMVAKNVECLRKGSIAFIIAQHGYQQGYNCIDKLYRAVVLKREVRPVDYMPIELITNENAEYYRRTQL